MLQVDTTATVKSMQDARALIRKKLKYMVADFASNVANIASQKTPVVNQEDMLSRFLGLYETRKEKYGIAIEQGYHAGSWVYNENELDFDPEIYTQEEVQGRALADARTQYELGDSFTIGSKSPAIEKLNNGESFKAPDGIAKPTLAQVEATYRIDLIEAYNRG